jgi:hypothetical protein
MSVPSSPDRKLAAADPDELDRLPGVSGQPVLTPAGRWRAEYRKAQQQLRLAGVQPDLFGAPDIVHFHRNAKPPAAGDWPLDDDATRFQDLSVQEQGRQLAADPQTPWARSTRRPLTPEEKIMLIAGAANWLRLGQRVRIISAARSIDGGNERRMGRVGVIWRLCSPVFADHVHVNLDLIGQERSEKIVFVELRDVVPIDD